MGNEGWQIKKLGEITDIIGGGTPKTNIKEFWDGNIIWLSPTDLPIIGEIVYINDSISKITEQGLKSSSTRLLPKGTVVFSSRASIGKIGIADIELCTNQGFANFICKKEIDNKFLAYALKRYTAEIARLSNSTTFAEVSKSNLREFSIPLPPLPEQHRIVAKLDSLFERIDRVIALVEENINSAQHLMASVLNDVFDGLDCESKKINDVILKTKQINPTVNPELRYTYIDISAVDKERNIITSPNTFLGKEAPSRARKEIKTGDILFATTRPNLKNIAIVEVDYDNPIASTGFCVLRVEPKIIENRFLFFYLIGSETKEQISPFIRGAQYPAISDKNLLDCTIKVPSLTVQKNIADYLAILRNNQEDLIASQNQRLNELKALKSSLLDAAFRGDL